jgi:N-acetylglutamate synthase-like GNAT family acetyltransferase
MNSTFTASTKIDQIKILLIDSGLPVDDISEKTQMFTWEDGEEIIGCAGIENYGHFGLIRSVAISSSKRNEGLGAIMIKKLLSVAVDQEIKEVYILTNTAERFFTKLQFSKIDRKYVPEEIKSTSEFASVCPSSAIVMRKTLSV